MNSITLAINTIFISLMLSGSVYAEDLLVIVNKANSRAINKAFVVKAFGGEMKSWPDGRPLNVLNQSEGSALRSLLNARVLGKSDAAVKAAWAQKIFSGKVLPPEVVSSNEDMIKAVAANKNAIGYIAATAVDKTVKVVFRQ